MPEFKLNKEPPSTRLSSVVLAAALLLGAGVALSSDEAEQVRALTERGDIVPLETLIAEARARKPGTLIEAELDWEPRLGVAVYELLMLGQDGELWEIEFDARTGELLEVEREHH